MKKKFLVIVTTNFPYGLREPFLETELYYHAQHFQKIYLLVQNTEGKGKINSNFHIPENVMVIKFNHSPTFFDKIKFLRYVFSYTFLNEIIIIKNNYELKLNRKIIKTLLSSIINANAFSYQLKKFLKSMHLPFKRTVVYTYWCTEFSLGAGILNKRYKIAGAFSRIHNWDLYLERADNNYLPMRKQIFTNLNGLFPVSEQAKNYLLNKIPSLNADKILVARLGVEKGIPAIKLKQKGKLKILSLAFLGKVKRIDLLILALEKIEGIEIEWHHIGEGNDHLNINQYVFNRLFNKSNIKYNITGDLTKKQVYERLREGNYNLLINTSQYEGIPVSMMEAMSFGIPVIGTNVGGVSEIIDDGINGFLMSPNPDATEIINTLKKFDKLDKEQYQTFCNNSLQTWETKFNAELNYSELIYNMLQLTKNYN